MYTAWVYPSDVLIHKKKLKTWTGKRELQGNV